MLRALEALQRTTAFIGNVIEREPILAQSFPADARVKIELHEQRYGYDREQPDFKSAGLI